MTDSPQKRLTKAELEQQFDSNGWAEKLAHLTRVEYYNKPTSQESKYPKGTSTIGYEYLNAENKRVAIVFEYIAPDGAFCGGRLHHPKLLLIDGTWCYI
jgi:hypothetical protein